MRSFAITALLATLAVPAWAQGSGRFQPPPDHWMTFDSLVAAVGITDQQREQAKTHYDQLNAVMKKAADERQTMRSQMSGGGPPSPEQRQAMADKMQGMQQELDKQYDALRAVLTGEQQERFDALQRPRVMMRRPGGGGPPQPPGS